MRKFIMFLMVLFATIGLTGCFTEADTLEWKTLPKSVYDQKTDFGQADIEEFKKSVTIVVNGVELTLAQALSQYPYDMTFDGFDLKTPGQKTITIKFKTLSIYWAYVVGDPVISTVTPEYGWYGNGSASTFILNNVNDLYGFANIVNGKRLINEENPNEGYYPADSFANKTVKLGADIDLTGKIWEPIGAVPRKINVALNFTGDFYDTDKFTSGSLWVCNVGTPTIARAEPDYANSLYFDVTKPEGKNKDLVLKLSYSFEELGVIKYNEITLESIKNSDLSSYKVGEDGDIDPGLLKQHALDLLNEKLTDPDKMILGKIHIGKYLYAEVTTDETGDKTYQFFTSKDVEEGNFFSGTFDGQGHKIIGLSDVGYTPTVVLTYANSSTIVTGYTFGLFGVVTGNVAVKNLTFEDVSIVGAYYEVGTGMKAAEIDSVGAAIGFAFGDGNLTLDNIKVLSGSITAQMAAGGIIGRFYNKGNTLIQNCENRANITLTNGGYHAGGVAGYGTINTDGTKTVEFINNTNYGNIITGKVSTAGAMINYVGKGNKVENKPLFDNCRNFGNIYGSQTVNQTDQSWGLVGQSMSNHNYNNCVNYGTVTNELPQS